MNSTGNKLSGGVAMSFKVIALGLFVVSFVLGNVGLVAANGLDAASIECSTTSFDVLPTPSIPGSTTGAVDPISGSNSSIAVTTILSATSAVVVSTITVSASVCSVASPVTVTVTGGQGLTTMVPVASVVMSTSTATPPAGANDDTTTIAFTTIEVISTGNGQITSTITTEATITTVTVPGSINTTSHVWAGPYWTGTGASGSWGTISPAYTGNSTFAYSLPSASTAYPSQLTTMSAANGNSRGSQVFYCVVMIVTTLGLVLGF
ncbi:hypothetical protein QBC42DRAFT_251435 [Cladorrhinum samala]|uniref:Uncharacterized protein n=1 Tax=Cladorrhinum samala TaxID=585594 RepID=A0AAV9HSR5_9PEZI|nr:hypothetical protein QBC42DRAFT_251435 [Cladorrhinum samala]